MTAKALSCFGQRGLFILLATLLLLALAACGDDAATAPTPTPTPPAIHYGEDICEFCGMIVSEERFAAGYITPAGQERIFDDIGDMVQAHLRDEEEAATLFVHDYNDHTWIRAETAHYVLSPNLPTPMLSGLAAFPTAAEADSLASELGGQVLTFEELLSHYRKDSPSAALSGFGKN